MSSIQNIPSIINNSNSNNKNGYPVLLLILGLIINIIFLYYSVMYIVNPIKVPETFVYIVMILIAFSSFLSIIYGIYGMKFI